MLAKMARAPLTFRRKTETRSRKQQRDDGKEEEGEEEKKAEEEEEEEEEEEGEEKKERTRSIRSAATSSKTKPIRRPIICIVNDLYTPALRPVREVAAVFKVESNSGFFSTSSTFSTSSSLSLFVQMLPF